VGPFSPLLGSLRAAERRVKGNQDLKKPQQAKQDRSDAYSKKAAAVRVLWLPAIHIERRVALEDMDF
jgi:hypothetical protein